MSALSPLPTPTICVLDTNMIIFIKKRMKAAQQWEMLEWLDFLVENGWLTYPKQVAQELERADYPDGPGIWAISAKKRRRYPEPSDESMADVLGVAPGLFDPNEERNQADPYVVALAYELRERYPTTRIVVATENTRDQPPLLSPGTACARLELERLDWDSFLAWLEGVEEFLANQAS